MAALMTGFDDVTVGATRAHCTPGPHCETGKGQKRRRHHRDHGHGGCGEHGQDRTDDNRRDGRQPSGEQREATEGRSLSRGEILNHRFSSADGCVHH